jgi:hypothetical protein
LLDDSGVSMDSDLSRSMDQLNGQSQIKSFSLAKNFLQVEEPPPDEDDDIQAATTTAMDLSTDPPSCGGLLTIGLREV